MAKSTSPSPPHNSKAHGYHVDVHGPNRTKVHVPVKNKAAAAVIGAAQRSDARKEKGRS